MLDDADDAEDVGEETFWQAWRTAGQFDRRRASASTWLVTIARTRALDRLRARHRRAEHTADAAASALLDSLDGRSYPAVHPRLQSTWCSFADERHNCQALPPFRSRYRDVGCRRLSLLALDSESSCRRVPASPGNNSRFHCSAWRASLGSPACRRAALRRIK